MKKLIAVLLAFIIAVTCSYAVLAFDAIHLECEDGIITGAAMDYKSGNIQEQNLASGGSIVGMSGDDTEPTLHTTITFVDVAISEDGLYRITLRYDTNNDTTKKVDFLIDGIRYNIDIPMDMMPDGWNEEYHDGSIELDLAAGKHNFAVTTSKDFNRDKTDPAKYVKSVNADYIEIEQIKAAVVEEKPADTTSVDDTPIAPQTSDPFTISLVFLAIASTAIFAVNKKSSR